MSRPSARDFESTLLAARAGGEWAWAALYRQFSPPVLGYLRARGAAEPEDVLGEVFLQVARDVHRFEGDERAFRGWLFTIAHHRLLDEARRRGRRPVELAPADVLAEAGPHGDVEGEALEEIGTARVLDLMSRLSPDQQNVLLLRILGDMTVEEVARTLGKRPGAVKALQRRALEAVKRELEAE